MSCRESRHKFLDVTKQRVRIAGPESMISSGYSMNLALGICAAR